MHKIRLTLSQESLTKQERDILILRSRLEDELKSINSEEPTRTLFDRCNNTLMLTAMARERIEELAKYAKYLTTLKTDMVNGVSRISWQYENCINQMKYRISVLEEDLASANQQVKTKGQEAESLILLKEQENARLQARNSQLEEQIVHLKQEWKTREDNLVAAKAAAESEVANLNLRINQLLVIVHQRNQKLSDMEIGMRQCRRETMEAKEILSTIMEKSKIVDNPAAKEPEPVNYTLQQFQSEEIDVIGVVDSDLSMTQRLKPSMESTGQLNQTHRVSLPSPSPQQRKSNETKIISNKKRELKELDVDVLNRMQVLISQMTSTHRAKLDKSMKMKSPSVRSPSIKSPMGSQPNAANIPQRQSANPQQRPYRNRRMSQQTLNVLHGNKR